MIPNRSPCAGDAYLDVAKSRRCYNALSPQSGPGPSVQFWPPIPSNVRPALTPDQPSCSNRVAAARNLLA
jgi:hypothetical protein